MNYTNLLLNTKEDVAVTLKKTDEKGVGLYATKSFKINDVIAYYKVKIFKEKDYISPTNYVYSFKIYRKNGQEYKRLIGDIYEDSFPQALNNITFWGPFANELSKKQYINAEIDINSKENYSDKTFSVPGETAIYKLVAVKPISPGEEIVWFYGDGYARNYVVGE